MKNILSSLVLMFIGSIVFAGNPVNRMEHKNGNLNPPNGYSKNMIIDSNDTVVFDLSHAVINGNHTKFPVYILTDDTVFALDFSFRYNETDFVYDSVFDYTNYLQPLANYDSVNHFVRFTSYSLQPITNDTPLVAVRFMVLSGQFCNSDLDSVSAYLNGDLCSFKIINCIPAGIDETNNDKNLVNVYPNPANDFLNVYVNEPAMILLMDINGKQIISQTANNSGNHIMNTHAVANGIYVLKVYNEKFISIKQVVINR